MGQESWRQRRRRCGSKPELHTRILTVGELKHISSKPKEAGIHAYDDIFHQADTPCLKHCRLTRASVVRIPADVRASTTVGIGRVGQVAEAGRSSGRSCAPRRRNKERLRGGERSAALRMAAYCGGLQTCVTTVCLARARAHSISANAVRRKDGNTDTQTHLLTRRKDAQSAEQKGWF